MHVAAAWMFCAILAALSLFQLALIAGAPIGALAWGGQHRVLPAQLRIGSAVSIVIYAVLALIVLQRAGIATALPPHVADFGVWGVVVFSTLGVIVNFISRSRPERLVMTPVASLMLATSLTVALA